MPNSRYKEWLTHIFDHEVNDDLPQWYFNFDDKESTSFEAPAEELVSLINQTFRCSGTDLLAFTDSQVNQGLWYLVSASCSDFMFALRSPEVPKKERGQAIESIYYLYADCFAKRCAETLGHLSEEGSDLNPICYMFWDICPLQTEDQTSGDAQMNDCIFTVFKRTLKIDHRACREGALHGLGHWFYCDPQRTHLIVEQFLKETTPDPVLAKYAECASKGDVQ